MPSPTEEVIALKLLQQLNEAQAKHIDSLKGGGGGGTSGGMEARLAKLESDMEHVKTDLTKVDSSLSTAKTTLAAIQVDIAKGVGEIKAAIATMTEQTKHFPTRWEVFLMLVALLTAVGVVVALVARFIPPA